MPSSSASTHQLGRRLWTSVRDSVDLWAAPYSLEALRHGQRRSLTGLGIAQRVFVANVAAAAAAAAKTGARSSFGGASRRPQSSASLSFLTGRRLFGSSNTGTARRLLGYRNSLAAGKMSPNNVRRSCTSGGGLLLLGLSSPSTQSSTVVATCTAAADTALSGAGAQTKASMGRIARHAWPQRLARHPLDPLTKLQHESPLVFGAGVSGHGPLRIWSTAEARRYKSTSRRSGRHGSTSRQGPQEAPAGPGYKSRFVATDAGRRSLPPPQEAKSASGQQQSVQNAQPQNQHPPSQQPPQPVPPKAEDAESIASSMSKYLQSHLPKIPHRPTKEELLAAATGFWQRLQVRFKWFSIRSMRPWNADEWGAFVSWFMLGHLVWILVGTTTFVSLVILTINTVFAQETLAKWVGDYLTQSAGITVVFESAIVPKWKNGVITFHNVFVSRRPGQVTSSVMKGSSSSAAAIAAARHTHDPKASAAPNEDDDPVEVDDGNYTQFDVTINTVDVTLSFYKWWNGKGLLKDVEVRGVRGVVDRTFVSWGKGPFDPFSYRHEHQPGDFEIERFKLEDLMVTIHQPSGFRPFSVSIFSCELPQLRKQWLFYDFLSANHISGSFDGSLFTIHPRQIQQHATAMIPDVVDNSHHNINNPSPTSTAATIGGAVTEAAQAESTLAWKKFTRMRIDGLKIDHLNSGDPGPFGWIYEGNVDIVADVMLPAESDESLVKVVSDFYDKMEGAVTSNRYIRILHGNYGILGSRGKEGEGEATATSADQLDTDNLSFGKNPAVAPYAPQSDPQQAEMQPATDLLPQYVVMDLRLHLNDVRAAVPFFPASDALGHTRAQSYVNAALIRPIVAYINAKRTYIPISCRVVKHLSDFDGSWTLYDCGLMDDMSAEVYAAFAHDVEDQQSRVRRLKKVGFWTLSMVVHALLAGVAGDYM